MNDPSDIAAGVRPEVGSAVARLYDTYPFPPEPLLDEPPPGYNWRWHWLAAYSFCTGQKPRNLTPRILDAGCGTGVGTEYLVHLNPESEVVGIDISAGALAVARERCRRSGGDRAQFHQLSLFEVDRLPGMFDYINCVGVLHHTADPIAGIQALAAKLAPGGSIHIFVYADLGRWEIRLMQEAIALIQGDKRGDYTDGVAVGRQIFASLPEHNRLLRRERERWSLENQRDANFADMYLHPWEIDYRVDSLFDLIDASGLEFLGFSNPDYWQLERLLGKAPELMARVEHLSDRQRYRLIELLDPDISHYEFFLGRSPLPRSTWADPEELHAAIPERHPCMYGYPSRDLMDYNYQPVTLTEPEFQFLEACDGSRSVGEILTQVALDADGVRSLQARQLLLLSPARQP